MGWMRWNRSQRHSHLFALVDLVAERLHTRGQFVRLRVHDGVFDDTEKGYSYWIEFIIRTYYLFLLIVTSR